MTVHTTFAASNAPPRNRRPPPRRTANPSDAPEPTAVSDAAAQVREVRWLPLVLTTMATTLAGYATLELVKAVHRRLTARKADDAAAREEARRAATEVVAQSRNPEHTMVGARPDGTFGLPVPGSLPVGAVGPRPSYTDFAQRPPHWVGRQQQPRHGHAPAPQAPVHAVPSPNSPEYTAYLEARLQSVEAQLHQQHRPAQHAPAGHPGGYEEDLG